MRTPEQVAADDALTAAIDTVRRAYFGDEASLLTDYVVVLADQTFDEDGDSVTGVGTIVRDGDLPSYRTVGLLELALVRQRHFATLGCQHGDDDA